MRIISITIEFRTPYAHNCRGEFLVLLSSAQGVQVLSVFPVTANCSKEAAEARAKLYAQSVAHILGYKNDKAQPVEKPSFVARMRAWFGTSSIN